MGHPYVDLKFLYGVTLCLFKMYKKLQILLFMLTLQIITQPPYISWSIKYALFMEYIELVILKFITK